MTYAKAIQTDTAFDDDEEHVNNKAACLSRCDGRMYCVSPFTASDAADIKAEETQAATKQPEPEPEPPKPAGACSS